MQDPTSAPIPLRITLRGHESGITTLVFSPDGKWLATGSIDDAVGLWDMQNPAGEPIVLPNISGPFTLAFSPDGNG